MAVASLSPRHLETNAPAFPPPAAGTGSGAQLDARSAQPDGSRFLRRFVMTAPLGFHVRPAVLFVKTAMQYGASILVAKTDGDFVNGKSITGLLTLEIQCGEEVVVSARGSDAAEAMAALACLFADAFGREDQADGGMSSLVITAVPHVSRPAHTAGRA